MWPRKEYQTCIVLHRHAVFAASPICSSAATRTCTHLERQSPHFDHNSQLEPSSAELPNDVSAYNLFKSEADSMRERLSAT